MKPPKSLLELKELSKEIHTYHSILSLLHWDQETYMPKGAITPRSEQIALLSKLIHEKKTGKKYKALLEKLVSLSTGKIKVKGLSQKEHVMIREWRKDFFRYSKLPTKFVEEFSQVTAEASQIWAAAKKENNFKIFAPFLSKIIDLNRKKTEFWGFEDHPYDALLEAYEPCMTSKKLTIIFDSLKKELISLLKKIQKSKQTDDRFLKKKVSDEIQKELADLVLSNLPVEMAYTRLDVSSHPFSMALHPHDSRITTRFIPNQFVSNILSVLHEAGHSFYEMGLSLDTWGTPLSEAISLSVHESQSRWWETLIGRSFPYWKFFYPKMKKVLPKMLTHVPLERFYKAMNKVSPSLIRVEADEVTYCLHVILRFEIEKELIAGDLSVDDLPLAWNQKIKDFFGISVPSDAQGCMQDIHWSLGDFGYFPTYALGNLLAAHLFSAFDKKHPDWGKRVAKGDLGFIRDWLKLNVHRYGKTYNLEELAKKVTGKPFSEKAYCAYLKKKYSKLI